MFYCSFIPAATVGLLSRLGSNPPSSHVQRRKTSFKDARSRSRVCGAANQERKPLPVPKLPCTGAQLPKRGRIKVIPEQDSREMPVQTPLVQALPPSPPKSLSPTRGHRQAEVTSLRPAAQHPWPGPSRAICWHVGRHPRCVPRGLAGCLDALSRAQEPLWQGASLVALPRRTPQPAPWHSGDRAGREQAGVQRARPPHQHVA